MDILIKISLKQNLKKYFEIHENTLLKYKKDINNQIYIC